MASYSVNTATRTIELFGSAYDEAARADIAALEARSITGAGLAIGGGDLSADRVITVAKASGAEADAGTADDRAVTPLALATPLTALWTDLVLRAPLDSPAFSGLPTAPQRPLGTADGSLATTSFVAAALEGGGTGTVAETLADHLADYTNPHQVDKTDVGLGAVQNLAPAAMPVSDATQAALNLKAPLDSAALTGVPTTVLPPFGDDSSRIASTAFVAEAVNDLAELVLLKAPLASPVFTGVPQAAQAALGTATGQLATTSFVAAAISNLTGDTVADDLAAHLADHNNPHATTKAMVGLGAADNTADLAKPVSTAQQAALNLKASLASPVLTGVPQAPQAAAGTSTGQLATTSFVAAAVAAVAASDDSALEAHLADHNNPHAVDKADVGLSAVVNLAPAALPVSDATQTALNTITGNLNNVSASLAAHTGNTSNPHAVDKADVGLSAVQNTADLDKPVSNATQAALNLKAPLVSPAFTGVPTAPKAALGTNTTQLATTSFVSDATALLAPLASPHFTLVPTAPTAALGTDTTQLATTSFVQGAVNTVDGIANSAQEDATQALADAAAAQDTADAALAAAAALPDLIAGPTERPGDAPELFGVSKTGTPESITRVDPTWVAVSTAGNVLRVQGSVADDPQVIAPLAAYALEPGRLYEVRFKVQRQSNPADPLNDSVTCGVQWMTADHLGIAGPAGQSIIDNIPLVVADGVEERLATIAYDPAADVDYDAPGGTVYFRPFVELYGNDHITDVVVIEAGDALTLRGPLYMPVLDADPVVAPGHGRIALYARRNMDGTANLRIQGGTSTTALDIIVLVGVGV